MPTREQVDKAEAEKKEGKVKKPELKGEEAPKSPETETSAPNSKVIPPPGDTQSGG